MFFVRETSSFSGLKGQNFCARARQSSSKSPWQLARPMIRKIVGNSNYNESCYDVVEVASEYRACLKFQDIFLIFLIFWSYLFFFPNRGFPPLGYTVPIHSKLRTSTLAKWLWGALWGVPGLDLFFLQNPEPRAQNPETLKEDRIYVEKKKSRTMRRPGRRQFRTVTKLPQ